MVSHKLLFSACIYLCIFIDIRSLANIQNSNAIEYIKFAFNVDDSSRKMETFIKNNHDQKLRFIFMVVAIFFSLACIKSHYWICGHNRSKLTHILVNNLARLSMFHTLCACSAVLYAKKNMRNII